MQRFLYFKLDVSMCWQDRCDCGYKEINEMTEEHKNMLKNNLDLTNFEDYIRLGPRRYSYFIGEKVNFKSLKYFKKGDVIPFEK